MCFGAAAVCLEKLPKNDLRRERFCHAPTKSRNNINRFFNFIFANSTKFHIVLHQIEFSFASYRSGYIILLIFANTGSFSVRAS